MVSRTAIQYGLAALTILGIGLGLFSIIRRILKSRVNLRVRIVSGRQANLDGTRYRCPWIEIANLGARPVCIDGVGISKRRGGSELLPGATDRQNNPPPWLINPQEVLVLPLPLMPGELRETAPVARSVWVSSEDGRMFHTPAEPLLGFVPTEEEYAAGSAGRAAAPAQD